MAAKAKKASADAQQWYQRHDNDTWSPEYQTYLISQRITDLQNHLQENHKDFDAKRSLLKLVAQRRSHLKYLKRHDMDRYIMVGKNTWLKIAA